MRPSRAKWRILKKCSHENPIVERTEARLLYLNQTCEHQVFGIRRANPALRFLTKRVLETPFFASISKPTTGSASVWGETEWFTLQDLASPWDTIPITTQDATYQRGAAMTRRDASISVKRATQNTPKTQMRAMTKILELKRPRSQHRDTNAAHWRDSSEAEADVIHIWDSPSPPPRTGLTTHGTPRAEHHIHALARMAGWHPKLPPWRLQYHPFGEGRGQAGTVLRSVQGKKHGNQPLPTL